MNRISVSISTLVVSVLTCCSSVTVAASDPSPAPLSSPLATASPGLSPVASSSMETVSELPTGAMEPGAYSGERDGLRLTFTIPAPGWSNYPEAGCCVIFEGGDTDGAIIFFGGDVTSLYARACDSEGTEITFGPTVDDLANAMASLVDFEVSGPTDVTLGGFPGKRVGLTVPMGVDVVDPACDNGEYRLNEGRHYQAPGQTDDNWILDVDGQRFVITFATTPNTPADVVEQVEQTRDSLVIERI